MSIFCIESGLLFITEVTPMVTTFPEPVVFTLGVFTSTPPENAAVVLYSATLYCAVVVSAKVKDCLLKFYV